MRLIFLILLALVYSQGRAQNMEPMASPSPAVVPIDWSKFAKGMPQDEMGVVWRTAIGHSTVFILTNPCFSCSQNMKAKFRAYQANPDTVFTFQDGDASKGNENLIRPPASFISTLAIALQTGAYNAQQTGVSRADAAGFARCLINSVALQHKVNGGYWGNDWQSSLWCSMAGLGGWLMWDDLNATTRERVRQMVEYEANRFLLINPPVWNGSCCDTRAEENAWDATSIELAASMMPNHPNRLRWVKKAIQYRMQQAARKSDLANPTIYHGRAVKDWITGYNLFEDGSVVNHGINPHPDYMGAVPENSAYGALSYSLGGFPTPKANQFNLDVIYSCFVDKSWPAPTYAAPGGTIYRSDTSIYWPPANLSGGGESGRRYSYYKWAAIDGFADILGFDVAASKKGKYWEPIHGNVLLKDMAKTTGQPGASHENNNEWAPIEMIGYAYLMHWLSHQGAIKIVDFNPDTMVVNHPAANGVPMVSNTIPNQSAIIAAAYSFSFPANIFSDPDGDSLTYSASLLDGSPLPAWLSFNAGTRTFSGTAPTGSNNLLIIKLMADDSKLQTSTTFSLTLNPAPVSQQVVSFTLVDADSDQDLLTLTSGTSLNLATLLTHNLNIRANTDPINVGSVAFSLTGQQSRSFTESGAPYSLFGDVNGNYNAWMPATGSYTLKGTPFSAATSGGTQGTTLTISFTVVNQPINQAPVVSGAIPDQTATIGTAYSFAFAANTFSDPDNNPLTYSASLANNAALPAWLSFNASTRTFSGNPPAGSATPLSIKVTASDSKLQASTAFSFTIQPAANRAPVVSNTIPNQTATIGTAYSFAFAANTFSDPDNDPLTYSTILANNAALPAWLSFNAGTRTFSGTAPSRLTSPLSIKVTASDGKLQATTSTTFSLEIKPAAATALYLINAGGPALVIGGRNWMEDKYFDRGNVNVKTNVGDVANTTDDGLYYSERYRGGTGFNYNIPVPSKGTYTVKLHFAETNYVGAKAGVGKRVFNVSLEGQPILTNFDITAQAGTAPAALTKTFTTEVSDGKLTLTFTAVVGDANISAIEVYAGTSTENRPEVMDDLLEAYPNPFTEKTTLEFAPLEDGRAVLDIFNAQGGLVEVIFSGQVKGGEYRRFEVGSPTWSSGIYIVRLQTSQGVAFKRLVLQ